MELNQYIDHTNLKPTATREDICRLCREAAEYGFASVCINPTHIALAEEQLRGTGVKVCTVIGFPLGANTAQIKAAEAAQAIELGCDEVDMVINVGALKDGRTEQVREEIAAVRAASVGKTLKVIIETGLLTDEEKVLATKLSCEAGADFVKTCTGVSQGVATVEDVRLMKRHVTAGVRIKASAGIRTYADALAMIEAGADRLGTSAGTAIMQTADK